MEISPLVSDDFTALEEGTTLSQMVGALKQQEKRAALIFHNGKYKGLVQKKWLLRSRLDAPATKIDPFVQKTPIINENDDLISTAYLMYQSNLEVVPVGSGKQIIGVLRALDLALESTALPELHSLKVKDIPLQKPSRVQKDAPVSTAMSILYKERIDHVPVMDGTTLYGVITHKDIIRRYLNWSPRRNFSAKFNKEASTRSAQPDISSLASLPVSNFSTNDNLLTVLPTTPLKEVLSAMVRRNVHDALVLDKGVYTGLLTVKNVLRRIASLKIPRNFNIAFVGLNTLDLASYEKKNIQKICSNEAFKLQRLLKNVKNEFSLHIHFKEYHKEGMQHKYSVHMKVQFPGQTIAIDQEDWDIETAVRKTFENAKNRAKRVFGK